MNYLGEKYEVEQADYEVTSHSGIALLGDIMRASKFKAEVDKVFLLRRPNPELSHGDILSAMTGLIFLGKPDFDAIKAFKKDSFFRKS